MAAPLSASCPPVSLPFAVHLATAAHRLERSEHFERRNQSAFPPIRPCCRCQLVAQCLRRWCPNPIRAGPSRSILLQEQFLPPMLLNEYHLQPWTPQAQQFLVEQMEQFFFGEGSALPQEYVPPSH